MSVSPCLNTLLRRAKSSFLTCRVMISRSENFYSTDKSTDVVAPFVDDENLDPNAPVRFSTSRAAMWKVQYKTRILNPESLEDPNEEFRFSLYSFTILALAVYALVREGNEWDDEMAMPLGKRMLVLREYQMRNELETAISNKEDTSEIKLELQKIANLRKEYNYD